MIRNAKTLDKKHIYFVLDNIALHKKAWQAHPYDVEEITDIVDASHAVDGLKPDLSINGNQCTLSANFQSEAVWLLDLGADLSIHHIKIYYRTDNLSWGIYN